MNLREIVKSYKPFNKQEEVSKGSLLRFIDEFGDDIWTRDNIIGHMCASAWVVNKDKSKVLMVHHNIYNSWGWLGGHADGEKDLLKVAMKEVTEESGVKNVKPVTEEVFGIDVGGVGYHIKRGNEIAPHLHYDLVYLLEADEAEKLTIKEDENSGVKWIPMNEIMDYVSEEHMKPVYQRFINKMQVYKL